MNLRLKLLVIEKFGTQTALCRHLNMDQDRLSKFIHGRLVPYPNERQAIAAALEVEESALFPTAS